jgi:hypothetical protein
MNTTRRELLRASVLAAVLPTLPHLALAQRPATARIRGTITAISDSQVTVKQRNGDTIEVGIAPDVRLTEVYPVTFADVKPGTFVGVGGMPQPDGSQRAIAVVLFPEAMRGTGEGHYPFDFLPDSTMTNATVADVASSSDGRRLELKYKDGQKTIVVPPDAPVVSLRPGDRAMLQVGSGVSMTVQDMGGKAVATRINAGRNGFNPPY